MANEYYRYLGYGVTNENGVAKLDHDANGDPLTHSYTGVGAGEIDVVASLDNPVSSGSIVSGTLSVWDTLFYDEMTPYTASKWSSTLTPTQNDDGITVAETSGTSTQFNSNFTAIEDTIIEFDVTGISVSANSVRFYYKGADHYINSYLTDNNEHHFKFVCSNGTVTPYVDNVEKTSKSTTSATGCRFILNNASIKFRNFKIYSL